MAKHVPKYNQFIRTGSYGEFRFYVTPGMVISETDYLQITFPNNDVSAQTQTYLTCGFTGPIESATCIVISTAPLTINIYGPTDAALNLAAATR